ncbi:MAG: transcriptional regulator [Gloeotrichia echinulata DEX184]|nr:transcriptional regulator [Gloeotrichia echinulata DEX184]
MTTGLTTPSPYYLNLITEFPPRPITNEAEFMETQQRINSIIDQKNLNQDDRDYLRVLGILVYDYEEKNEPFPKLNDSELLKTLMDDYNLKIQDLLGIFEQEKIILDILNGKRTLTYKEAFKVRALIL